MNAGLRLASPFTSAFPPSFGAGLRRLGMLVAAVALVGCGDSTPGKPPAPPTTPMVSERCVMPAGELAALGKGISVGQQDLIDIKPPHGGTLTVTACVDRADNTYALGEEIRLFVKTNKNAYLQVINSNSSGQNTVLFPNAYQREMKVSANKIVEIPPPQVIMKASYPTGKDVIKVIASEKPIRLPDAPEMTGPFKVFPADIGKGLNFQLNDQLNEQPEWAEYSLSITTVTSR